MTFELWEIDSGNAAGEYRTEAEALAAVQAMIDARGRGAAESFLLARTNARGRSSPIAQGAALVALALSADEPRPPARRTTTSA
ncbi:MAG: hypothetical protein M3442_04525 [Chloroflexota bacterium]|nr:hypothetical protein [Chloroflexota bacterium]